MKKYFFISFFSLIICFSKLAYSENISGYISFWFTENEELFLPKPFLKNIPLNFDLKKPNLPGHLEREVFVFNSTETFNSKASIEFYSICNHKDEKCEKIYYSLQVKLSGDSKAFCGAYFNKEDFFPFPILICSGYFNEKKIGITLHREKY